MPLVRQLIPCITASALLFAGIGTAHAQQAPLAGLKTEKTMYFVFEEASVGDVLGAMSQQFGFVVVNEERPAARITVQARKEYNATDAIILLNEILVPLGYVALVTTFPPDLERRTPTTVLRVVTVPLGRRAQIPVFKGADPLQIPLNDDVRTQIIPLNHIPSVELVKGLQPLMGGDSNLEAGGGGTNTIIITDTSAKIRRLVEIIHGLDKPNKPKEERQGGMRSSGDLPVSPVHAESFQS